MSSSVQYLQHMNSNNSSFSTIVNLIGLNIQKERYYSPPKFILQFIKLFLFTSLNKQFRAKLSFNFASENVEECSKISMISFDCNSRALCIGVRPNISFLLTLTKASLTRNFTTSILPFSIA